jgi:hypothetical protein
MIIWLNILSFLRVCFLENYYWFVQYIDNDNGDVHIN